MTVSLSRILGSAVLSVALVACGGSGKKANTSTDMKASTGSDAGVKTDGGAGACTAYGPWATDNVGAFSTNADTSTDAGVSMYDYEEGVYAYQAAGTLADILEYDYFHLTGSAAPTTPSTVTLGGSSTYSTCVDCLQIFKDVDPNDSSSGRLFFADSGSLTITKRDHGALKGTVAASATGPIHFSEWDTNTDAAVVGGACLTLSSFSITENFDNTSTSDM